MQATLNELKEIFKTAFETEVVIDMGTARDDIGEWTSINHLNLIVELEDFYHVSFSMDEIRKACSVKEIVAILAGK